LKYYIYYESVCPIHIQFFNENNFFKYSKENFPMLLYMKNREYYFEINISDYKVGENIILQTFDTTGNYIKYQYKSDFSQNNLINLGLYNNFNYIPIKKTKNDSSLILYIKYTSMYDYLLSILNIVKDDVMEIDSDLNLTFKGPQFLFLDYVKFNNLKSFAIESDKKFFFYEQEIDKAIQVNKRDYNFIYISKQNAEKPLLFKKGFIYFNSTEECHFMIKKFNFSIIEKQHTSTGHEYLSLCHGEEPNKELYYYKSNYISELFTPVYGNFDSFYINEGKIKSISDLDFNNIINEGKAYIGFFISGYLKIVCKGPTMIKHSYIDNIDQSSILFSGRRYYFSTEEIPKNISLSDTLFGKIISLKISMFGTESDSHIELFFNRSKFILGNKSLEFEFEYSEKEAESYLINFNIEKDKKNEMLIEIVVGSKENISSFEIRNLDDIFGNFKMDAGKGVIIKVPKEYDENYYNFSIIKNQLNYEGNIYIEISYDKIELMASTARNPIIYEYSKIISFFVNPYFYIPNNCEKSNEKYFYIFIFAYSFVYKKYEYIFIKRPKLFTDINFKKINTFPQLKGEDEKYYYRIPFPNVDNDSLLIQSISNLDNLFSLSKYNTIYPLYSIISSSYYNIYNVPFNKNYILSKNTYLNYYGNCLSDGFVNFIPTNQFSVDENGLLFSFNLAVKQKGKTNKFIISLKSYSYYISRPIIYYLIINEQNDNDIIFSALTEKRNFDKNKMMLKVEDNGENEIFQKEVEIDIELFDYEKDHTSNKMIIIPVDKETNLIYTYSKDITYFNYESFKYTFILFIVIGILVLIIIIISIFYMKRKKEKNNNIGGNISMNEEILSND